MTGTEKTEPSTPLQGEEGSGNGVPDDTSDEDGTGRPVTRFSGMPNEVLLSHMETLGRAPEHYLKKSKEAAIMRQQIIMELRNRKMTWREIGKAAGFTAPNMLRVYTRFNNKFTPKEPDGS